MLLEKHPNEKYKRDKFSKWWKYWYHYSTCKHTGEIFYGDRILIGPNINLDSKKNLQWETIIQFLGDGKTMLYGPFNFKLITEFNPVCQNVNFHQWKTLRIACEECYIVPPKYGAINNHSLNPKQKPNKRNQAK